MSKINNSDFDHNRSWQSDKVAEAYDARRFTSVTGAAHDRREKAAIAKLLDLANGDAPIKSVLDLPAGTGRISELLVDRGYDLTCGDISKEMLEVAERKLMPKKKGELEFEVLDIYNIKHSDNTFDCVSCIRLFQHLKSDERAKALKEMGRVSKGYLIVNVMHTGPYYGLVRAGRKMLGAYAPRYTTSASELKRELDFASLRLVKSIYSQPFYSGNRVLLLKKI